MKNICFVILLHESNFEEILPKIIKGKYFFTVVAIDIDEEKIKMAKHNAGVYGVEENIEFVHGDFMEVSYFFYLFQTCQLS